MLTENQETTSDVQLGSYEPFEPHLTITILY